MQSDCGSTRRRGRAIEEALAIRRKALPEDHPDIADSLNNLGIVQCDCGSTRRRGRATRRRWPSAARPCPEDHPDIARSLLNLGWMGLDSGVDVRGAVPRLAEATDLFHADQLRLAVAQAEKEQLATAATAKSCLARC